LKQPETCSIGVDGVRQRLHDAYGALEWWPADNPFEVMVGAILTQNTTWSNVELALQNFAGQLSPQFIDQIEPTALSQIIRPAGYYNQKAIYLKAVTAWFGHYNYDADQVKQQSLEHLRSELLAVRGVGPETADSILLYAFEMPTFVVDAYTMRLCRRLPIPAGTTYSAVRHYFMDRLPTSVALFNDFHAQIVNNAKDHCRAKPICEDCPLGDCCQRLGL
jgi:endonuclease-3 related protein